MKRKILPTETYLDRIRTLQAAMQRQDLDAVLVVSSEAEPANVRYFTDYWPVFETAGLLVPAEGDALLLTGPESERLVRVHSRLYELRKLLEFRESSDPEYPDIQQTTFDDVLKEIGRRRTIRRIGLIGTNIMTVQVYQGLEAAARGLELVRCDPLLRSMRMKKSKDEQEMLRTAAQYAQSGFEYALSRVRPGMTEIEAAAECMYGVLKAGAETPGFMIWCVSGPHTDQAIGKSTYRVIQKNEMVQFTMGAMAEGYVSSFGRPFSFGHPGDGAMTMWKTGLEANLLTHRLVRAGANAGEVARSVHGFIREKGLGDHIVYGPAHGIGMMECEFPFIETTSDYQLEAGMTFAVDTFLAGPGYGMRYEDTVIVTDEGEEQLAPGFREILVL